MATFTPTDKQRALKNARQEIAHIEGQDTPNRVAIMAERARGYLEALTIMGAITAAQYAQLLGEGMRPSVWSQVRTVEAGNYVRRFC